VKRNSSLGSSLSAIGMAKAQHPYHRASRLTKTTDNDRYALPAALALAHLAF
jgi:hypothetical protein